MHGVTVRLTGMSDVKVGLSEILAEYPIEGKLVQLLNQPPNRMNIGGGDGCAARHG